MAAIAARAARVVRATRSLQSCAWVGADDKSSRRTRALIQIHEEIDKEYPGLVDLTELFDFPTVAQLARHLESKIAAQAG